MNAKIVHVFHPHRKVTRNTITPEGANINEYDVLIHEYEDGVIQIFVKDPGDLYGLKLGTRTGHKAEDPLKWKLH